MIRFGFEEYQTGLDETNLKKNNLYCSNQPHKTEGIQLKLTNAVYTRKILLIY